MKLPPTVQVVWLRFHSKVHSNCQLLTLMAGRASSNRGYGEQDRWWASSGSGWSSTAWQDDRDDGAEAGAVPAEQREAWRQQVSIQITDRSSDHDERQGAVAGSQSGLRQVTSVVNVKADPPARKPSPPVLGEKTVKPPPPRDDTWEEVPPESVSAPQPKSALKSPPAKSVSFDEVPPPPAAGSTTLFGAVLRKQDPLPAGLGRPMYSSADHPASRRRREVDMSVVTTTLAISSRNAARSGGAFQDPAWAMSVADEWKARQKANKDGPGWYETVKVAREMGVIPEFFQTVARFADGIHTGSVDTEDASMILADMRDETPAWWGFQMSSFMGVHPCQVLKAPDEGHVRLLKEIRLTRTEVQGLFFAFYATMQTTHVKITVSASMDYPACTPGCKLTENVIQYFKDNGMEHLLRKSAGSGIEKGNNLVRDLDLTPAYISIVISIVHGVDEFGVHDTTLEYDDLMTVQAEASRSEDMMTVTGFKVNYAAATKLRFIGLADMGAILRFRITAFKNNRVSHYSFNQGGRLFTLAEGGRAVVLGIPRCRVELRAVDPACPAAYPEASDRLDFKLVDQTAGLDLGTIYFADYGTDIARVNPGKDFSGLVKAARDSGWKLVGPEVDLGVKSWANVHAAWLGRTQPKVRMEPFDSCMCLLERAAASWSRSETLKDEQGTHEAYEQKGELPALGKPPMAEVSLRALDWGFFDGRVASIEKVDEFITPNMPAEMGPVHMTARAWQKWENLQPKTKVEEVNDEEAQKFLESKSEVVPLIQEVEGGEPGAVGNGTEDTEGDELF